MKKNLINRVHVRRLDNASYLQLLKDTRQVFSDHLPPKPAEKIINKLNELAAQINTLEAAFSDHPRSAFTQQLIDADRRRDRAIIGLRTLAEGFSYSYDTDFATHGSRLFQAIDKYGRIATASNEQETSIIDALVKELREGGPLNDALTALNLNPWMEELANANAAFNQLYLSRVNERAADTLPAASILRSTVNTTYYDLLDTVEAFQRVSDNDAYNDLIRQLNALHDRYDALASPTKKKEGEPA